MEQYLNFTWHNKLKKEYGWTRRLILKFYPTPDFYVEHHNPDFRPYHMLSERTIQKIMDTDEFKKEWEKTKKYSAAHAHRPRSSYPGRYGYQNTFNQKNNLGECTII